MRGLVYLLPEDEIEARTESLIERYDKVTIAIDRHELREFSPSGVALVGLQVQRPYGLREQPTPEDPLLEYVCSFRKGSLTSFQGRLVLERFHRFPPISLDDLQQELPRRLSRYFGAGLVAERTWQATLEALRRLRPSVEDHLDGLLGRFRPPEWVAESRGILGFERDAVDLSIRMAGLEVGQTREIWRAPTQPQSFLSGLTTAVVREDSILAHEMNVFGDWERLQQSVTGAVRFVQDGAELTIVNINRTPLEKTLGADLMYFTDAYDACVLVQYKMLSREGNKFAYRPPSDRSLADELSRMQSITEAEWDGNPLHYRLGPGSCYLKFCYREVNPFATSLAAGLYLPLELWLSLAGSDELRGPRGGIVLQTNPLPRHLSNEEFVKLVGEGWVGSRGATSQDLQRVVDESLATGRSVTLAHSSV